MTHGAVFALCCLLACCGACIPVSAAQYAGYAVLPYNVEYAIDMACPTVGDILAQVVASGDVMNPGATFAVSRGSSLPLPAATGGLTSMSYVSGIASTPSRYYLTIKCETTGGCVMNWDVMYYCKSSTGTLPHTDTLSKVLAGLTTRAHDTVIPQAAHLVTAIVRVAW